MKRICCAICAVMLLLCMSTAAYAEENWLSTILGGISQTPAEADSESSVAVLYIEGEISRYSYDYDHYGTLDAVAALAEDPDNVALMLVMNTPGGSLYDADELYHEIMQYKETGRPVYCYMEEECCSAGVYIAMAADTIMASRMTITGSVGVYMQTYSEAGLYDLLGIDSEYIATGENKVAGYPELTQQQREIYQALVDESFAFFKQAIAESRGLDEAQMQPFLDGRLLSAYQALELGLIDSVLYLDEAEEYICAQHGDGEEDSVVFKNVTPEMDYGLDVLEYLNPLDWLGTLTQGENSAEAAHRLTVRSNALKSMHQ